MCRCSGLVQQAAESSHSVGTHLACWGASGAARPGSPRQQRCRPSAEQRRTGQSKQGVQGCTLTGARRATAGTVTGSQQPAHSQRTARARPGAQTANRQGAASRQHAAAAPNLAIHHQHQGIRLVHRRGCLALNGIGQASGADAAPGNLLQAGRQSRHTVGLIREGLPGEFCLQLIANAMAPPSQFPPPIRESNKIGGAKK
jgi:hypothetical protein